MHEPAHAASSGDAAGDTSTHEQRNVQMQINGRENECASFPRDAAGNTHTHARAQTHTHNVLNNWGTKNPCLLLSKTPMAYTTTIPEPPQKGSKCALTQISHSFHQPQLGAWLKRLSPPLHG
eukprot:520227-Pelagomonas_calceolata.AAC.1